MCSRRRASIPTPRSREPARGLQDGGRRPEFTAACDKIDAPLTYFDGPDHEKFVAQQMHKEKVLFERLKLKALLSKG